MAFTFIYTATMMQVGCWMWVEQTPLELFHFPPYIIACFMPHLWLLKKDEIKKRAAERAEELKALSSRHNKKPIQQSKNIEEIRDTLEAICKKLEKSDIDVSPYIRKLQEDWYESIDHLRGKDVDILNRYMPRHMAESLFEIVNCKEKHK